MSLIDSVNVCTLVSFMPIQLLERKSGIIPPDYLIPAAKSDREPGVLHVGPAQYYTYLDMDRGSLKSIELADNLARAICNDFANSQLGVSEDAVPGMTWFPGRHGSLEVTIKFADEVKETLRKHYNWYRAICFIADNDWQRYHHHNAISDIQRHAGKAIGLDPVEHEWIAISNTADMPTCPVCKQRVRADVIICPTCRCVLNKEEYDKFTFAQ